MQMYIVGQSSGGHLISLLFFDQALHLSFKRGSRSGYRGLT